MNNYLKKFNLLYEEIMNQTTITVDTFDFNFEREDNGNIICKFDVSDNKDELYNVIATINTDNVYTFKITNKDNKEEELEEKSFMLRFYKDYNKFKKAYKQYIEKTTETKTNNTNNKQDKYIVVGNKNIPKIELFNNKLRTNTNQTNIKINNTTFIFRKIEDETKNLIQINFDLLNEEKIKDDQPYKFNVICIVKLLHENSIPLKFILIDSNNDENYNELTRSNFADKFKSTYLNLLEAINQYEKTI